MTTDETRRAGIAPDQIRERNRKNLAILEAHGQGDSEFARAMRRGLAKE